MRSGKDYAARAALRCAMRFAEDIPLLDEHIALFAEKCEAIIREEAGGLLEALEKIAGLNGQMPASEWAMNVARAALAAAKGVPDAS